MVTVSQKWKIKIETEASKCINSTSSKHYILHPHLNSPLKHEINNYYKRLK